MEKIQVALRVRPLNSREYGNQEENVWTISNNSSISAKSQSYKDPQGRKSAGMAGVDVSKSSFTFDYCFQPRHDNQSVYQTVAKSVILSSLSGYNGTIFMYGQTGSGKTYTMMGYTGKSEEELHSVAAYSSLIASPQSLSTNTGILIQSLKDIFSAIETDTDKTYFLKCSYVEIYNDQIYDLLSSTENLADILSLAEDPAKKEFYVRGVIQESVSSIEEILEKLQRGELNRHYASTTMNHSSSRSHTIFRLHVQTVTNAFIRKYRKRQQAKGLVNINNADLEGFRDGGDAPPPEIDMTMDSQLDAGIGAEETVGGGTCVTESYLNFVDLAGSEKVSNHQGFGETGFTSTLNSSSSHLGRSASRDRVKEGKHINKSLFFLTQVISLMSEGKSGVHIPFRNSPLTKILRSSLGGNSRTLIILCVTPAGSQYEQTMSTLRFGANAKKIENKVTANIVTNDDSEAVRIMISDYEARLRHAESQRKDDKALINKLKGIVRQLTVEKELLLKKLAAANAASKNSLMNDSLKKELQTMLGPSGKLLEACGLASSSISGLFGLAGEALDLNSSKGQFGHLSKKDYTGSAFMCGDKSGIIFSSDKAHTKLRRSSASGSVIDLAQNESAQPQLRLLHEQLHLSRAEIGQIKQKHDEYFEHFKASFAKLIEWVIFYRENLEEVSKHCSLLQKTVEDKEKEKEVAQKEANKDNSKLRQFTDDAYIPFMSDSDLHDLEIRALKLVDMAKMELVVRTVKLQLGAKDISPINHGKFISMKHGMAKIHSSTQTDEVLEKSTTEKTKKKKKKITTTVGNPKIAEILQKVTKKEKEFAEFLQSSQCDFGKMTLANFKFKFDFEGIDNKWRETEKNREKCFDDIIKKYTAGIQEQLLAFERKINEATKANLAELEANKSMGQFENDLKHEMIQKLGINQKDYIDPALENLESSRISEKNSSFTQREDEMEPMGVSTSPRKPVLSRSSSSQFDKKAYPEKTSSLFDSKLRNEERDGSKIPNLFEKTEEFTAQSRTNNRASRGKETKMENYNAAFSPDSSQIEAEKNKKEYYGSVQASTPFIKKEKDFDNSIGAYSNVIRQSESVFSSSKARKDSVEDESKTREIKKKRPEEDQKEEELERSRVSLAASKSSASNINTNILPPAGNSSAKKPPQSTPRQAKGASYVNKEADELEKSQDGARRNLDVNELLSGLSQTQKNSSNAYHTRNKSRENEASYSSMKQGFGTSSRPSEGRASSKNQKASRSRSRENSNNKSTGSSSQNNSVSHGTPKQTANNPRYTEEKEMTRRMLEDQGKKIGGKNLSKKVVSMRVYELEQPEAYECAGSDMDEEESNKVFANFAQRKMEETDRINGMRPSLKKKVAEEKPKAYASPTVKKFEPSSMENLEYGIQGSYPQTPTGSLGYPMHMNEESSFESGSVMSNSQEAAAKKVRKSKEDRKKNK